MIDELLLEMQNDSESIMIEMYYGRKHVEKLSDHELVDSIQEICPELDESKFLDNILLSYFQVGKLHKEDRERLEATLILYFCNLGFEV